MSSPSFRVWSLLVAVLSAASGFLAACSSDDPGGLAAAGSGGGSMPGIVIGTGAIGNPVGPTTPGDPPGGCAAAAFEQCAATEYEGESIPLDIYLMFDQSGSMLNDVGGMTRLAAVQRATAEFLRAPDSAALGVGIGYFGYQPIGEASCSMSTYEAAAVDVTLDHELVIDSLNAREPTGETPTGAALQGACAYASEWKRRHPGRAVVIVLVTDGIPEAPASCAAGTCCPTLDDAARAARACAEQDPRIPTYVLGVGPALGNLAEIARAGNTETAYLVEGGDAATEVLRALNAIRGAASVPCELAIPEPPPGRKLDYQRVNLSYSLSDDCFEPLYHVGAESACGADGGWFYDDAAAPNSVKLCPSSCELVSRPGTDLRFTLGCQTALAPVH